MLYPTVMGLVATYTLIGLPGSHDVELKGVVTAVLVAQASRGATFRFATVIGFLRENQKKNCYFVQALLVHHHPATNNSAHNILFGD